MPPLAICRIALPNVRLARARSLAIAFALMLALAGCHSAFRDAMKRGDDLAAMGDWDRAAAAYRQAAGLEPSDEDAQLALVHARREQSRMRVARGGQLLQAGRPTDALAPFAEAVALDPRSFLARQGLDESERQVLVLSRQAVESGRAKEAVALARTVLAIDPAHAEARQVEAAARGRVADTAVVRGRALEKSGSPALAAVDYGEALEYRPDHAEAAARSLELRATLRDQVTFFVALKNFDGDEAADDLGSDVNASVLGAGLDPALPIRVVDVIPKSRGFTIQGMRLGGAFSNYAFKKDSARSSRTCDYVCGKNVVANPAYAIAETNMRASQTALAAAEGRVSTARSAVAPAERSRDSARGSLDAVKTERDRAGQDLDRCRSHASGRGGSCIAEEQHKSRADQDVSSRESDVQRAEQSVQSARNELTNAENDLATTRSDAASKKTVFDQTPSQVEVDKHCSHTYGVETVTVHGEVDCALHGEGLYDTSSLLNGGVTGRAERQDETFPAQTGVCPELLHGNPLNVPSQAEVKRLVVASAVRATQRELLGAYDRYRMGYLSRARAAAADHRDDEAADDLVRFLFTLAAPDASDPTNEAVGGVAKLRQVDDKAVRIAVFGADAR